MLLGKRICGVREGSVDVKDKHLKILHDLAPQEGDHAGIVALLGPPQAGVVNVEYLVDHDDPNASRLMPRTTYSSIFSNSTNRTLGSMPNIIRERPPTCTVMCTGRSLSSNSGPVALLSHPILAAAMAERQSRLVILN